MYQALYRKYRPSTFSDVCGQEHITSVLKLQLQKGRVSHAYIFCGSRGTGKTTCAKILAKAVNCEHPIEGEPCNACPSCLAIQEERVMDVVEMDAASNNGVDAIRRLCDEVQFLPSEAKKRVYIIDEVHMLSTSAFNALLKTIEEPPAHVLFILATTEINDIPATILSRCQRFDFKRILPEVVADRLMMVSQKEQIGLERDAAEIIARLSDGAMRDALSLLEACQGHSGTIDSEKVHAVLGIGSRESVISLCRAIVEKNLVSALKSVNEIYDRMSDFKEIIRELIAIYRDLLVIKTVSDYSKYVDCYAKELDSLVQLSGLLPVETLLYQTKTLEQFYVEYDRIATGKKASAEILMIRLCHENLSDEKEALLSRIASLEKRLEGGSVPQPHIPKAPKKTEEPPVEPVPCTPKETTESVRDESFSGTVKLRNLLQQENFLKPWLPQMEFAKKGSTLVIFTGAFVKGMLIQTNATDLILKSAQTVDPGLTVLSFEEKNTQAPKDLTGLEEL